MKWLCAKLNLALALVIHLLWKRWFRRRGLKTFLAQIREDALLTLSHDDRKKVEAHSNCIYCGLCVTQCEMTHPQFFQTHQTPASLSFSTLRSLPEISLNLDFIETCPSCKACEKVCPTGVPLVQIGDFIKKHVYS